MNRNIRITARVALFAALVFVCSYLSSFIFNVNPAFFIVFMAGFLWGPKPGLLVGIVGFFLYSNFSPFGPAPLPILISQLIGISLTALIGAFCRKYYSTREVPIPGVGVLIISGFLSGLTFHLVVDVVDAFIYQPFWPRLIGGLLFSLITIVSNVIIFAIMQSGIKYMYQYEEAGLNDA